MLFGQCENQDRHHIDENRTAVSNLRVVAPRTVLNVIAVLDSRPKTIHLTRLPDTVRTT